MDTDANGGRRRQTIFLLILAIIVSLAFLHMVRDFLVAVLLAAIAAGLLHPLYARIERRLGGRSGLAALVTVTTMLLCIVIPAFVILALVAAEAVSVSESVAPWVKHHVENPDTIDALFARLPFAEHLAAHKEQILHKAGEVVQNAGHVAAEGLAGFTKGAARFALLLFVFVYAEFEFLLSGRKTLDAILRHVPMAVEHKHRVLDTFTSVTRATLVGAVMIGAIQGTLAGIAFAVAGIHGALFWAVIMAVFSIIPGIGSAIVWVPAVVFLAVDGRYVAAISVTCWCAVVVGSVDNLVRPRLVGRSVELSNLMVLLGTLGGVFAFGAVGIVLGPVLAALFVAVWRAYGSLNEPLPT